MATLTMPEQQYGSPNVGVARDTPYTITYTRPNELRNRFPPVGPRPIADWADILAAFVAACNADNFIEAGRIAGAEYVVARIGSDVPSGKRTAFTTFWQANPRYFEGGSILP